jgi:hypothetical protein
LCASPSSAKFQLPLKVDPSNRRAFTYRHEDEVTTFCFTSDRLLVALPNALVEWDRRRRQVVRKLSVPHRMLDVKPFGSRYLLFSKHRIALLDDEVVDLMPMPPLCASIAYGDAFFIIGEENIKTVTVGEDGPDVRDTRLIARSGICSAVAIKGGSMFLGFENGRIYSIGPHILGGVVGGSIAELDIGSATEVAYFREPITAMEFLDGRMVVSFFDRKIAIFDWKAFDWKAGVKYTRLRYEVKGMGIWDGTIIAYDTRNNVVLLNDGLVIEGVYEFDQEICRLSVSPGALMLGLKEGMVKEYSEAGSLLLTHRCTCRSH